MNKKGIILSIYIYVLLVFFLLILGSLLVVLNNTRVLSNKVKESANLKADNTNFGFSLEIDGPKRICQAYGKEYIEPGFRAFDDKGNSIGVTIDSNLDIWKPGEYTVNYVSRFNNKEKTVVREVVVYNPYFEYTGSQQEFVAKCDGIYMIELWGAGGGGVSGSGAYTKGEINLTKDTSLYVFVGQKGELGTAGNPSTFTVGQGASATYNGGGAGGNAGGGAYPYEDYTGGASGGGATDVRLIPAPSGLWNNTSSLRSRIMVAGGGGGTNNGDVNFDDQKSNAGILSGQAGGVTSSMAASYLHHINMRGDGATQFNGNAFGIAGNGENSGSTTYCNGHSGGGGGYYGGKGGINTGGSCHKMGGGGGSSFISGYPGMDAISINGVHTNQPVHYSGLKFHNMVALDATTSNMPMPSKEANYSDISASGNNGNGFARITYLGTKQEIDNQKYVMKQFLAIGNNTGVRLKIKGPEKLSNSSNVLEEVQIMVRRKTTPWLPTDTISSGTLVSNNIGNTKAENSWYINSGTTGTRYYYKAFPKIDDEFKFIPYENETSAIAGGLFGEYTLEESLNDTSGNNRNPLGSAAVTYSHGVVGRTGLFNGTNSYVHQNVNLDSGTYSISVWFKMNSTATGFVVANAENGGHYLYKLVDVENYRVGVSFGGYKYIDGPPNMLNKWIHVVYVVNTSAKTVKVYHNGSLYSIKTYPDAYVPSQLTGADIGTCIGCNPNNSNGRTTSLNGSIDQVRFYNRELLIDEVYSLYNE